MRVRAYACQRRAEKIFTAFPPLVASGIGWTQGLRSRLFWFWAGRRSGADLAIIGNHESARGDSLDRIKRLAAREDDWKSPPLQTSVESAGGHGSGQPVRRSPDGHTEVDSEKG